MIVHGAAGDINVAAVIECQRVGPIAGNIGGRISVMIKLRPGEVAAGIVLYRLEIITRQDAGFIGAAGVTGYVNVAAAIQCDGGRKVIANPSVGMNVARPPKTVSRLIVLYGSELVCIARVLSCHVSVA